jgi:subfamily B ATP-binding cassette protein MsbA
LKPTRPENREAAKESSSTNGRITRLWPYLKPARWTFLGGILAGALYGASTGAGIPSVIYKVIPVFFKGEDEASPWIIAIGRFLFGEDYRENLLITACVILPFIFLLRGIGAFASRYLINKAGFIVLENIRNAVFSRLQDLPLAFFNRNKSGDLTSRIMVDTEALRAVVINVAGEIVKQPITLISSVSFLVYLSVTNQSALFMLVAILSVPLCVIPIRIAARKLQVYVASQLTRIGDLNSVVVENLQSPMEIRAYNLEAAQKRRFAERIRDILRISLKIVKYQSMISPAVEIISAIGFSIALYFGVRQGLTYETFTALALALYFAYEPIKKLGSIHASVKQGEASLDRLDMVLDATSTVPESATPRSLPEFPTTICFDNVSFDYGPRTSMDTTGAATQKPALNGVSVTIHPGETVALVGASGAGKSTFAALIPRFYDPTVGRILLGNIDLRDLSTTELRSRIALVPQQPSLFNETLAENIRVGRPGASDDDVVAAARRANIHDFILSLPDGYATRVGERGSSLSGGQRQRVAIARAFLKNAPILILDEATSALDAESESLVRAALKDLMRGRTTLLIAHRFSSIRDASRILVFEEGVIVADGPASEILAHNPIVQRMASLQSVQAD